MQRRMTDLGKIPVTLLKMWFGYGVTVVSKADQEVLTFNPPEGIIVLYVARVTNQNKI
jgi:hypothetical protein